MISHTAEYALRAVVHLARRQSEPLTTQQIAAATGLPAGYLAKVLQALGRAGIVHSQRGLHGGFTLTHAIDNLTILGVVNAVDPFRRIECCPISSPAHREALCPLHRTMDAAIAAAEKSLDSITIRQLLEEEAQRRVFSGAADASRS